MDSQNQISRRTFVIGSGAVAAAALVASDRLFAGARTDDDVGIVERMRKTAATAKITTQSLRGGIGVLLGAGGNIAVLSGRDGKVLIDAGLSTARRQLLNALTAVGDDPVRYLINTHWHFDHTDGNEWLHAEGALIVAHENARKHLATATRVQGWQFTFPASPAGALPVMTFRDSLSIHVNNSTILLEAVGPAHTDSDIVVEFAEADVIHVGDIWWNGHYPFIDYSTGGSIDGTIRAVDSCLARTKKSTIIIPGHGPVGNKAELTEFRDMLIAVRQCVAAMKKQGKSLAEIVSAKPTLEFDGKFGHFLMAPADFVGIVFAGV